MPYSKLIEIMNCHGVSCTPKEFYSHVNESFHNSEAACYDNIHVDMHLYLRLVWRRLTSFIPVSNKNHNILDVGCGTGIVGDMLAQFYTNKIENLYLLDPSVGMLKECHKKSVKWPFNSKFICGDLSALPSNFKYDLITINSVLHHIVDLEPFLNNIQTFLNEDGIILTAQDPRDKALSDKILMTRKSLNKMKIYKKLRFRGLIRRFAEKSDSIFCRLIGKTYYPKLAKITNQDLLRKLIIRTPLSMEEIYSVTDFHVPGSHRIGQGISIDDMKLWLTKLKLMDYFTYQYSGLEWTCMNRKQKKKEIDLFLSNDMHGAQFSSVWKFNSGR